MEDSESDKKDDHKRTNDRSPSPAIKSTAVVKYTTVQSPVEYARLQCNTDLNLPPSNWGSGIDTYGLKQILTGNNGLSSFRMAHMFPDCVGEVDVISGAECIKKLLKLPYQPNGTVSMMVHRVENTLLLDDFDVYHYLVKSDSWSWLREFFYSNILKTMSEQERMTLMIENQSPQQTSLQLTSKFLCHSVASLPEPAVDKVLPATTPMCLEGPFLPEPELPPSRAESPPCDHLYDRNVHWTFEDIHMLIGSDLPIFGGKERPCVSLRLRDANEPINVLTGIDYWLDNLMCNVPEVLMCYHLDGIVQKYEPMKTEDLPNMENSNFSPKIIRNVAQNILSFLKSNATRAGHTYWLFKGPHDDVVKLYDLTSLCPDSVDNPFTTPVAMLLYRVARNMRLMNRSRHVKELLEQALQLLDVSAHAQLVASARYMLADLYVPATTNPAQPDFKEDTNEDSEGEDDMPYTDPGCEPTDGAHETQPTQETQQTQETPSEGSLAVLTRGLAMCDLGNRAQRDNGEQKRARVSTPLGASVPARCGKALAHALQGLRALHHVTIHKCKEEERERFKHQIISEEQHPKMANPFEPIKMDYEPLKKELKPDSKEHQSRSRRRRRKNSDKNSLVETNPNVDKNAILIRKENNTFPSWHEPNRDDNFAWKLHLKTLLYEKICLAYATLAEYSYSHEQFGFSLKYIDMASKCQKLLSNMIIKSRVVDASCLIGRVGDNYFQLSKSWHRLEQFQAQFQKEHEVDSRLREELQTDLLEEVEQMSGDQLQLDVSLPTSDVESMLRSCEMYRRATQLADRAKRSELLRRLASVSNELAVRYMNDAQKIYLKYVEADEANDTEKSEELLKQFNELSQSSAECLDEATEIFESVNDVPNLALLYCNKGRYMRFKAHCDKGSFNASDHRALYARAEQLYQAALQLLGPPPGAAPQLRELVTWELSSHLYTRAALMQEHADYTTHEANEVAQALQYALKHCPLSEGARQHLYQFRAAMLHHRLASLYHSQYRLTSEDGPKRRTLANATRTNYAHAANMFAALEDAGMYLTVTMEHVALQETQAQVSPSLKLKSLQTALQLLRQCRSVMSLIESRSSESSERVPTEDERASSSEDTLLALYEARLHHILKSIIQYCRSKSNKDYEKLTDMYKRLYSASLRIKKDESDVRNYARSVCTVLAAMDDISREFEQ